MEEKALEFLKIFQLDQYKDEDAKNLAIWETAKIGNCKGVSGRTSSYYCWMNRLPV